MVQTFIWNSDEREKKKVEWKFDKTTMKGS